MSNVRVSLAGKTALVTGANTGIGLVTARELARAGAKVWIACRSRDKGEAALGDIRTAVPGAELDFLPLDLASLASVRSAADTILASGDGLSLLVNNAGLGGAHGKTADGFEIHFAVNHLGHYLLTRLLLDRLKASAPARIVNVASTGHYRSKGLSWERLREPTRSRTGLPEYFDSKLANVLFAKALARRLEGTGVTACALHPGVVASDIWRRIPQPFRWLAMQFMLTNEQGAATSLHCATAPELGSETGLYYDACAPRKPSRLARDAALCEELWTRSAVWVGMEA